MTMNRIEFRKIPFDSSTNSINPVQLRSFAIGHPNFVSKALYYMLTEKDIPYCNDVHESKNDSILPLWHIKNPPFWTVVIFTPRSDNNWIRFDIPYLIPTVSTALFTTYLQILNPSSNPIHNHTILHPSSEEITILSHERIIHRMDKFYRDNFNLEESYNVTHPTRRQGIEATEMESIHLDKKPRNDENPNDYSICTMPLCTSLF